jgi:hypothetical protein
MHLTSPGDFALWRGGGGGGNMALANDVSQFDLVSCGKSHTRAKSTVAGTTRTSGPLNVKIANGINLHVTAFHLRGHGAQLYQAHAFKANILYN